MKNKILRRLILYFMASFLVFALVIGLMFSVLFSQHNIHVHHAELERRAVRIAETLSAFIDDTARPGMGFRMGQGMGGMGSFIRHIEHIAMSDVWIVDSDAEQIMFGHHHRHSTGMAYYELPAGAEQIISEAFGGSVAFDESFSLFWDRPTITVAAPIILPNGLIAGVVLLHSELADISYATNHTLTLLLYSMGAAVFVSVLVAIVLSTRFTKPLNQMKAAALQVSGGDFNVKTQVLQKDEIGDLASVFDDMVAKLSMTFQEREQLDKLRQDFVANISHELRTPITVMRGSLEALLDGIVSDTNMVREYHSQMLKECTYLERLVSDLLDLSRLQNTEFAMESQVIDLKDVTEDVTRTMTKVAQQKGVSLTLSCDDIGFPFVGDYGRLRQMLIIVADNAVKFSPQDGEVQIRLYKDENTAHILIRDEGSGIHPTDLDHIFERFYKQRSEQNKTGTGLGLAIAKQIADRHGIAIHAANHDSGGAVFTFAFPLAPPR
ncbi:MAG: HAMP domain-containing histidine kinase [Oscillospiraceae bacterium]|nr:HAMP domain-containing histidine kinase [Oscillospiraceae bacterium]